MIYKRTYNGSVNFKPAHPTPRHYNFFIPRVGAFAKTGQPRGGALSKQCYLLDFSRSCFVVYLKFPDYPQISKFKNWVDKCHLTPVLFKWTGAHPLGSLLAWIFQLPTAYAYFIRNSGNLPKTDGKQLSFKPKWLNFFMKPKSFVFPHTRHGWHIMICTLTNNSSQQKSVQGILQLWQKLKSEIN